MTSVLINSSLISTLILFILTYLVSPKILISLTLTCVIILMILNTQLIYPIIIIFIIGFLSDLSLNMYSRIYNKNNNSRSIALTKYFKSNGSILSALFGGSLTVLMILNTYAITSYYNITNTLLIFVIGFAVGVLWGIIGHYSKGMKSFKVFYDSTSGYLESRFWDGITIPFVLFIMFVISFIYPDIWIFNRNYIKL